jgi:hypothetical protein
MKNSNNTRKNICSLNEFILYHIAKYFHFIARNFHSTSLYMVRNSLSQCFVLEFPAPVVLYYRQLIHQQRICTLIPSIDILAHTIPLPIKTTVSHHTGIRRSYQMFCVRRQHSAILHMTEVKHVWCQWGYCCCHKGMLSL